MQVLLIVVICLSSVLGLCILKAIWKKIRSKFNGTAADGAADDGYGEDWGDGDAQEFDAFANDGPDAMDDDWGFGDQGQPQQPQAGGDDDFW